MDISLFKCSSTLCILKRCCLAVLSVTRIKNMGLRNGLTFPFAGRHPWGTSLDRRSKLRRPFVLVDTMNFATERGPNEMCLTAQNIYECFIVNPSSSSVSKC